MINGYEDGGLKMIDIETFNKPGIENHVDKRILG